MRGIPSGRPRRRDFGPGAGACGMNGAFRPAPPSCRRGAQRAAIATIALASSLIACGADVVPVQADCRQRDAVATDLPVTPLGRAARAATTYYVRPDGGDASQCSGRADTAYTGTNRDCAWKHPFYALGPDGSVRIAGGDILIIGSGSYRIGEGAPGAAGCSGARCYPAAIPSGPSSRAPTRILGKSCSAPPRLRGAGGVDRVLNLEGSSNIEVGCLEITDGSDCVYAHSVSSVACTSATPWARGGIYASASRNVWLH
ncbi:hypothetical protein, partial [Cognatiluteimonas weifangensis]